MDIIYIYLLVGASLVTLALVLGGRGGRRPPLCIFAVRFCIATLVWPAFVLIWVGSLLDGSENGH